MRLTRRRFTQGLAAALLGVNTLLGLKREEPAETSNLPRSLALEDLFAACDKLDENETAAQYAVVSPHMYEGDLVVVGLPVIKYRGVVR